VMDEMLDTFRNTPTVGGAERVLIAGQREFEIRDERMANGIPLHPSIVTLLGRLAEETGVPMPEPLA
jgi:LDH2 family malate/lactate/ureidoglycolate dehydrogenase